MINVGLLGAGRIGKVHAKSITAHPGSKLVAIADVNHAAAEHLAKEAGAQARAVGDIIEDRRIDAVLIATSTDTHSDLIEAATAAGKAVLCEKPVDLSLARAQACQAAAARYGRPVMIGFNRRFDPNFAAVKKALDAGEIGKGELLSITSFDPSPPRPSATSRCRAGCSVTWPSMTSAGSSVARRWKSLPWAAASSTRLSALLATWTPP